jgi:hypothetical protein
MATDRDVKRAEFSKLAVAVYDQARTEDQDLLVTCDQLEDRAHCL